MIISPIKMLKNTVLFGKRIEFNPTLDYGIKNSRQQFGLLNVEDFLKKLNHQDELNVMSFLRERIFELNYIIRLKKLVCYIHGSFIDDKKESVIQSYKNTIKLFESILRELKRESVF